MSHHKGTKNTKKDTKNEKALMKPTQHNLSPFILCVSLCVLCAIVVNAAPPFYRDNGKLLVYLDTDGKEHPITNAADWQRRREHILANIQEVMGPLPDESR